MSQLRSTTATVEQRTGENAPTSLEGDLFVVDESSDLPIWAQLRNRFTFLIRSGSLKEGEQLPSVRSLAAQAHINYNTVARAYRDLELAGLVGYRCAGAACSCRRPRPPTIPPETWTPFSRTASLNTAPSA